MFNKKHKIVFICKYNAYKNDQLIQNLQGQGQKWRHNHETRRGLETVPFG